MPSSQRFLSTRVLACVAALLAALSFGAVARAETVSLRVMSFNVRYAGTYDDFIGPNGWFNLDNAADGRRFKVQQVIRDYGPDLLGAQELLDFQYQDLAGITDAQGLSEYDSYGIGREDGVSAGEHAAIFYRRDRFARVDAGTFWLSHTPTVPGSIYPGAGTTRIASWVILDDLASGQQLFVLNTHLDNLSDAANRYSANLIRDQLALLDPDLPVVLTGDMNSGETSTVLRTLRGLNDPAGLQLGDSYREVFPIRTNQEGTFHGYGGSTFGSRIDFVLHSPELTPTGASIVHTSFGGKYPSDHFPVTAQFTLLRVPEPTTGVLVIVALATVVLGKLAFFANRQVFDARAQGSYGARRRLRMNNPLRPRSLASLRF